MVAFDRWQQYAAKEGFVPSSVVAEKGKDSIFLDLVNKLGYEALDENGKMTELGNVLTTTGNQVINAIAGSGKTTALSLKIIHDIYTGEILKQTSLPNGTTVDVVDKTWVCTFLKSGAVDLESSVARLQRELHFMPRVNQIHFSTLDAEFYHTLEGMGVKVVIGDDKKLFTCFKRACEIAGVKRSTGENIDIEDIKILNTIIKSVRGRIEDRYSHPSCADYNLTPTLIDDIIRQYANQKKIENFMDFEDVQELLYKYLYISPNPKVMEFVANRYNNIYIDEFQDTSQLQYALLKACGRNSLWLNADGKDHTGDPLYKKQDHNSRFVGVGDVSQCIYSFKGSDRKILAEYFEKDFRPTVSRLSCNWRCPSNILNPIITSIHKNADSANQLIYSAKEGGEFGIYGISTLNSMLQTLTNDVAKDVTEGMSVTILCRTNYDGFLPALALEMKGSFDFALSGDAMTLRSPVARKLLSLSALFTERSSPAVKSALEQILPYFARYEVEPLMAVLKNNNLSIWQVPEADLKVSAPEVLKIVQKYKPMFYENGKRNNKKALVALREVFSQAKSNYKTNTTWCMQARALLSMYISMLDTENYEDINDYLMCLDLYGERLEGRKKKKGVNIVISTVHEYKGKEADSVIIWNDSTDVFPSRKCDITNQSQLEEERRVHYIACTRARKRERIYTLRGQEGLFVKEMDAKIIEPDFNSVSKVL